MDWDIGLINGVTAARLGDAGGRATRTVSRVLAWPWAHELEVCFRTVFALVPLLTWTHHPDPMIPSRPVEPALTQPSLDYPKYDPGMSCEWLVRGVAIENSVIP
jgi:hypothetical protein